MVVALCLESQCFRKLRSQRPKTPFSVHQVVVVHYLQDEVNMGRASKRKQNRTAAPYTRLPLWSYLPDGSTWLFVAGVFLLAYGTTAMQFSRWNHTANALVHPVFHPWAILIGVGVICLAIKRIRRT